MLKFRLNNSDVSFSGDTSLSLLDYLRNLAGITTPKDGCSGQASCGACTVQVDDKAVLSCRTKLSSLEGKSVTTTEGLEQNIQDAFARAFTEKGGIQCGFCIPGIVMRARVLLLQNLQPTREEVKKVINPHLCRCTGYKKIIDSILFTSEILRGVAAPSTPVVGKIGDSLPKYDTKKAVLGLRPYVADLRFSNMLYGALKLSDHPRALVKKIDTTQALLMPGVKRVLTYKDVPGDRKIGLIVKDWSVFIAEGEETHYTGDFMALVVADSEAHARDALSKIHIDYEILKPVTSAEEGLLPDAPKLHPNGNTLSLSKLKRGDVEAAFKSAAYISEGTYFSQRIEHAFLETEACVAKPHNLGGVEVYSQGQGVYVDRKQIAQILNLDESKVIVHQVQNGGGFGGKEDLTVQGPAALASYLCSAPVMVRLNRDESITVHPKRHPMTMKYKVACDREGNLTALKCDILGDTGAYSSVGCKVLERAAGHAASAYKMPNIDLVATAVYTNNVPCGAMRGFGVNQTAFAMENCIDDLCEQGGFDRFDFRYKNALDEGDMLATGQILRGGIGLKETLLAVKDVFKNAKYAGIACGIKNTGIGNGMPDDSRARIEILSANKIRVMHGWTEMGQGVHNMAIQTVIEETGLDASLFEVRNVTSDETLCGMTTSSRGTSMVGNALIDACKKLKSDLLNFKLEDLVGKSYDGYWVCDWTTALGKEKPGQEIVTHYAYGYATQVVILNERGEVARVVAAHDGGRVMNRVLFEGQVEGGVHMGLGYALTEDLVVKEGRMVSTKLSDCGVLRAMETPEIEVIAIEAGDTHGPYGAKGIGEIGLVPTAAATACALKTFDGIRRYSLPMRRKKS